MVDVERPRRSGQAPLPRDGQKKAHIVPWLHACLLPIYMCDFAQQVCTDFYFHKGVPRATISSLQSASFRSKQQGDETL
jgi:hypothetical protein